MKTLYHYTSLEHARQIIADGMIRTTEPNLSPDCRSDECGTPQVVWLTTDGGLKHTHGLDCPVTGKNRVRFTVKLPTRDAHKWKEWAVRKGIDKRWMRALMAAGGGALASYTWRVIERPITWPRWVEVLDLQTGERLWEPTGRRDAS